MQRGEPLAVEPFLDAGNALVVDIDVTDFVADHRAVWVDALIFGQEADAGNAEPVDFLPLLGADPRRLSQTKTALRRQPFTHFVVIDEVRTVEEFLRFIHVDELARLGEQRRRLDVGGQYLAVAVEDVGPRGGDRVLADAAAGVVAVA